MVAHLISLDRFEKKKKVNSETISVLLVENDMAVVFFFLP